RVEAPRGDAIVAAVVVLEGDHEAAVAGHGHAGPEMFAGGVGIDLELVARCVAGGIVAPRDHLRGVDVEEALPGHDETAARIGRHHRVALDAPRIATHAPLAAEGPAGGVEAAGEDAALEAVVPDEYE